MVPVPWSYINSWYCSNCGLCCKEFDVVLRFDEWLNLVRSYGVGVTRAGLDRFYVGKNSNGTCKFLCNYLGKWFCGLQQTKPTACKLWPFKVSNSPRYGRAQEAAFNYKGRRFFLYVDPFCPEIKWGKPSSQMISLVIPEFVEIALGLREKQVYSTSGVQAQYDVFSSLRRGGYLIP